VDFGIASGMSQARRRSELGRIGATQLQGHGLLDRIETEMPSGIAMGDGSAGDHFGEQQGLTRQQAMEETAMPVRPVHHRGNAELTCLIYHGFSRIFRALKRAQVRLLYATISVSFRVL